MLLGVKAKCRSGLGRPEGTGVQRIISLLLAPWSLVRRGVASSSC